MVAVMGDNIETILPRAIRKQKRIAKNTLFLYFRSILILLVGLYTSGWDLWACPPALQFLAAHDDAPDVRR
jgi:hypothetical protein